MHRPTLHRDWRDLLWAGKSAFSDRKIALHARGLLIAYIVYVAAFYGTSLALGDSFRDVWETYGLALLPMRAARRMDFSGFLLSLATLLGVALFVHYGTAVGRMTFAQLRGDHFFSSADARAFARKHSRGALSTLGIGILVVTVLQLLPVILALPGQIPFLRDWWTVVGSLLIVPGFFVGLLLGFVILSLLFGVLLLPAISGVVGAGAMEVSYQLAVLVWKQGWRLLLYELLLSVVAIVSGGVFLLFGAYGILTLVGNFVSPFFGLMFERAIAIAWGDLSFLGLAFGGRRGGYTSLPLDVATVLTAVGLVFVTILVAAYVLSIVSTGNTLIYIGLRERIWGDNVLEAEPIGEEGPDASADGDATSDEAP